jgi:hypothetical protein
MWRYGIEPWTARGDAFAVYFGLIARLAPLGARQRRLVLRWPLVATTRLELGPGLLAVLCVMLGSTAFDGFSNGAVFRNWPRAASTRSSGSAWARRRRPRSSTASGCWSASASWPASTGPASPA